MVNQIRKSDLDDLDFLDAEEIQSDGTFIYLTTSVVSTTSGTKVVVVNLPSDGEGLMFGEDHPVQSEDIVILSGTSGGLGDGQFTVDTVLDDTSFSVLETIGTSTGGSINFYYKPGAKSVGVDPSGMTHVVSNNLQDAIAELDMAVGTGGSGITADQHKTLRQLIHLADEGGPYEGFTTGAYQESLPSADPFPTSIIWWTSSAKTAKIVEESIAYNANKTVSTDNWKVYNTDGSTLLAEITDTIVYSGVFELHRTRAITDYSVPSGSITSEDHKILRQLIHLAEEGGPYEGFSTGAYRETLPSASPFPTSVIWWTDSGKTSKIVEETITYNANKTVATDQWKVYATDGVTVLATVTDTVTYSGVFELNRTRAIA